MKKLACLAMVLAFASVGFAQAIPQDSMELILDGQVDFQGPTGDITYDLDVGLGYFVIDDLEVGPRVGFTSDGNDSGIGLGAFTEYNFDLDFALVPYVGLRVIYLNGKIFNENAVQFEGAAGVKFFLAENVAVSGEFAYDVATKDSYFNDGKWQDTDYGLNFGVRAYF